VALQALMDSPHHVIAVYTQPDRPAGRGRKLKPSPVKVLAAAGGVDVYQPPSLKPEEVQAELRALQPDILVVVAYGLILPAAVLAIPRLGCINIHASLLPRWRGAAPIQRAIWAGDDKTGVTIMQMDEGLDTGAMLLKRECAITREDTSQMLHDHLAELGAAAAIEALAQLQAGLEQPQAQDDEQANYAHKLAKTEAVIDWALPAITLEQQVRAFNPWPVSQTEFQGEVLRVWQAKALDGETSDRQPGCVIAATKQGVDVATGDGVLRLTSVQVPGGRPLTTTDLLNARKELKQPGVCLGVVLSSDSGG
jgi:methionyl-tRNA formyltransferase